MGGREGIKSNCHNCAQLEETILTIHPPTLD
jgi:hypothetical protein